MNGAKRQHRHHEYQPVNGGWPNRLKARDGRSRRRGFSLLEFSVASLIVGILMIGLTSSIQLVTRAAQLSEGPASRTTEAARRIEEVVADMRLAQVFKERKEDTVTFTVPDRDGDAAAEEITFDWNQADDGALRKTIKMSQQDGSPESQVLIDRVADFNLEYRTRRWGPPRPKQEIENEEQLLIAHDDFPQVMGSRLLMVIADADQPTAQENARKGLVEEWGFVVEWISDHASRSDFDAALAQNDLVYVSETSLSDEVGDKLKKTTLGVVNEEPFLADEFGLASVVGSSETSTLLENNVGTHFLTYGWLPEAPATLFSSGQPCRNLHPDRKNLAPDLEILATRSGEPALSVIPIDGELYRRESQKGKRLGETNELAGESDSKEFAERYVANRWTLPHEAECFSMTAYVTSPPNRKIRFGIYTDVDGQPDKLVTETDAYTKRPGGRWTTVDLQSPVFLQPGDYWLTIGMQSGVKVRYEEGIGTAQWADSGSDPTDGMMTEWTGSYGPEAKTHRYSMYATYDIVERAAGRRVQLPWGTDHLEVASLAEAGRSLLRRSLQWAADESPQDAGAAWQVTSSAWPAQYLFPDLPSNATGWKVTRLFCRLRAETDSQPPDVGFRLTHSDLQQLPSSFEIQRLESVDLGSVTADRYQWFEIPIDATGDLRPDRGICFFVEGLSAGTNLLCQFDQGSPDTSSTQMCKSWDSGNQWSVTDATHDLRFYAYGKYLTSGEPTW